MLRINSERNLSPPEARQDEKISRCALDMTARRFVVWSPPSRFCNSAPSWLQQLTKQPRKLLKQVIIASADRIAANQPTAKLLSRYFFG
jgi:hypothetical protein